MGGLCCLGPRSYMHTAEAKDSRITKRLANGGAACARQAPGSASLSDRPRPRFRVPANKGSRAFWTADRFLGSRSNPGVTQQQTARKCWQPRERETLLADMGYPYPSPSLRRSSYTQKNKIKCLRVAPTSFPPAPSLFPRPQYPERCCRRARRLLGAGLKLHF